MADLFARRARASEGMAARELTKEQVVKLKERLEREGWLTTALRPKSVQPSSRDLFPDAPTLPSCTPHKLSQPAPVHNSPPQTAPKVIQQSVDLLAEVAMHDLPLAVPGTKLKAGTLTPIRKVEVIMPGNDSTRSKLLSNQGQNPTTAALNFGAYEVLGKYKWLQTIQHAFTHKQGSAIASANSPLRRILSTRQTKQAQAAVLASGSFIIGTSAAVFGLITAGVGLWLAAGRPDPTTTRIMVTERNVSRRERLETGVVGNATASIGMAAEHAVKESAIVNDLAPQLKRQFGTALPRRES
eukprot:scaffold52796_cov36-Tisochrysis_lutea.AAC.1